MMQFDRNQCLYLGKVGTIPLFAHWTFLLLIWMGLQYSTGANSIGLTSTLLYLVVLISGIVLHELGHGLAAQAQGAMGVTITLWAFGGLCSANRDSLPRREIIILAAGPIVSFLLAWGAYLAIKLLIASHPQMLLGDNGSVEGLRMYASSGEWHFRALIHEGSLIGQLLALCLNVNLVLGIFNIMPIYPLDGGQIVFHVNRLFLKEMVAAKVSLALAMVVAVGYLAWKTQGGGPFPTQTAILLGFLLYNAFRYLS